VLQDEQFIQQELGRLAAYNHHNGVPAQEHSAPPPVAVAAAPVAPVAAMPPAEPAAPAAPLTPERAPAPEAESHEPARPAEPVSLHDLARAAAMEAERQAINDALTRFRWNRRKTAAHLKVSYKTLLNKMKECGIRGAELA
jgi:DNA-binding NtrC family response regulator